MIEISHRQARALIREGIDKALPDEQWSALQAHLESCAACRDFRRGIAAEEKELRRALQHRWSGARGPADGGAAWQAILRVKKQRALALVWLKRGLYVLGAVAVVIAWNLWRQSRPPVSPGAPQVAAARATTTPSKNLTFRGAVAYAEQRAGVSKTVLLTSGGGPAGITVGDLVEGGQGNEMAPAWSADGAWLAYLSDQAPDGAGTPVVQTAGKAKTELYVIHVSGTHRTRLTDDPDIEWSGPLSWSSDGKYIALTGTRADQGRTRWVYLVPLDGSVPRPLPGTSGVVGAPRFSQGMPVLAYSDRWGNLAIFNTESGATGIIAQNNNQFLDPNLPAGWNYDWSPGGHTLIYYAREHQTLFLRQSPDVDPNNANDLTGGQVLDTIIDPQTARSISWVPNNLLVATLIQTGGCWQVTLMDPYRPQRTPLSLSGLCVDGHLSPESFTSDGDWLVAWARTKDELQAGAAPALYALRVPSGLNDDTVYFEKLTNAAVDPKSLPDLAVRPSIGRSLGLNPRPAPPHQTPAPVSRPPAALGGLIFTGAGNTLMTTRPDWSDVRPLLASSNNSYCPALSPDRSRLAYVMLDPVDTVLNQPNQIVMFASPDGKDNRLLVDLKTVSAARSTGAASSTGSTPGQFDCPVWSPDGKSIAVLLRSEPENLLVVLPPEMVAGNQASGSGAIVPNILRVGAVSSLVGPRWTPDGKKILLVYPDTSGGSPAQVRVAAVNPTQDTSQSLDALMEPIATFEGWNDIAGLEYSPDGSVAAVIAAYISRGPADRATSAMLLLVRPDEYWNAVSAPSDDVSIGGDILHWLPDGNLAFTTTGSPTGPYRAYLIHYDPRTFHATQLLAFEDTVYNTAWSADGHWVAFGAESGLWALDAASQLAGQLISPLLVTSEGGWQVVWK